MAEILWPESGRLTLSEFEEQAGVRIGGKFVWPATPRPGDDGEQIQPLLAGLRDSAALFREYEQHHRRRIGSAHADDRLRKAERNADMAARLEELLKPFDRRAEEEENDGA